MRQNNNSSKKNRHIQGMLYLISGVNCLFFALFNTELEIDVRRIVIGIGVLLLLFSPISILDRRKDMCGSGATTSVFFIGLFCLILSFVLCDMQNVLLLCLSVAELMALFIVWKKK